MIANKIPITVPAIALGPKPESSCVFLGGGETKQTNKRNSSTDLLQLSRLLHMRIKSKIEQAD